LSERFPVGPQQPRRLQSTQGPVGLCKTITYQSAAHTYGAKGAWTNLHVAVLAYDPALHINTTLNNVTPPVAPAGYTAASIGPEAEQYRALQTLYENTANMARDVMTEDLGLGIHATSVVGTQSIANLSCEYCLYFKEV